MCRCNHCLKKQYCSQACIELDVAKGHTRDKLCKKEGEERKVKGGRKERVEKEKKQAKESLTVTAKMTKEAGCDEDVQDLAKAFKEKL